jgi:hypothetical protein
MTDDAHVTVDEVERAMFEACRRGHAEIVAFTMTSHEPSPAQPSGGHEWLIEFAEPPRAPDVFARALDETLQRDNAAYRAKRAGDVGMIAPRILELPAGTFSRWMRRRRTVCGRHQVPRITNDGSFAHDLLSVVTSQGRKVLILGAKSTDA